MNTLDKKNVDNWILYFDKKIKINISDIGTLNTNVSTNTADIGTLNTNVSTNTADIGTLNTNVSTNTEDIGTLNTKVTTNTEDIGTLNTKVTTNTEDIGTLETNVIINTEDISILKTNGNSNINSVFINYKQFEICDPAISIFSGIFNGYYYEFLELKNIPNVISTARSYFTPPSSWGQQNYNIEIYYLTPNDDSGDIQLTFFIDRLTMNSNVTNSNEFMSNNVGGFGFASSNFYTMTITPNTSDSTFRRPLQKYTITQYINFTEINFAVITVGRYMYQGYPYSDTYYNSVYIIGTKIIKV